MMSREHARAAHRSTAWVARHIDFRYASDRELLQIIARQPVNVSQGSARALAARWEAQQRGLLATTRQPSQAAEGIPPVQAPRSRYVQQPDPEALLLSLLLDDPGVPGVPVDDPEALLVSLLLDDSEDLLVSLLLDDPGVPGVPAERGE